MSFSFRSFNSSLSIKFSWNIHPASLANIYTYISILERETTERLEVKMGTRDEMSISKFLSWHFGLCFVVYALRIHSTRNVLRSTLECTPWHRNDTQWWCSWWWRQRRWWRWWWHKANWSVRFSRSSAEWFYRIQYSLTSEIVCHCTRIHFAVCACACNVFNSNCNLYLLAWNFFWRPCCMWNFCMHTHSHTSRENVHQS